MARYSSLKFGRIFFHLPALLSCGMIPKICVCTKCFEIHLVELR